MEKDKGLFSFRKHPVGDFPDGKKGRKRKGGRLRRSMGFLLAAALIFNTLPASGLAVSASEQEKGLCEHHTEHTPECGYAEAQPCTHEHGEECYQTVTECAHEHTDECYPETEATEESTGEGDATTSDAGNREPSLCTHVCKSSEAGLEESGCITKILDCHHEHDESCGYQEAQDCGYVCKICNGTEPEDTKENTENTEAAGTDTAECICETLCTEDNGNNSGRINGDCPVCGADDAGFLECKGKVSEENTENQEDTGICKHHQEHDADCGYIPKSEDGEGSPCTYKCRICPIEALIAALPEQVTKRNEFRLDNADDVRARLEEILVLYRELNEDEQEQTDISRCLELQEALNGGDAPASTVTFSGLTIDTADGKVTQDETSKQIILSGGGTYTISGTWENQLKGAEYNSKLYAILVSAGGIYDITLSDAGIETTYTYEGAFSVEAGASVNLTLTGENKLLSGEYCAGLRVPKGANLTIGGEGKLSSVGGYAGIGGGEEETNGAITINSGEIEASSREGSNPGYGAGIGGGYMYGDTYRNVVGDEICIKGGTVTAAGGRASAGIGGGYTGVNAPITITGGIVTAAGGEEGAGIGTGGGNDKIQAVSTVYIGGTAQVTATGNNGGMGIGAGRLVQSGNITIEGSAHVTANGIGHSSGVSFHYSENGTLTVGETARIVSSANVVIGSFRCFGSPWIESTGIQVKKANGDTRTGGIIFTGTAGKVYGSQVMTKSYELEAGKTLEVPSGASLTVGYGCSLTGEGAVIGAGECKTQNLTADMIRVDAADLYYTGFDLSESIADRVTWKDVQICGRDFSFDPAGWEQSITQESDLLYRVTYTMGDDSVSADVTVQQSGAQFVGDGVAKTYNGDTQTTTFNADDTITVKATPTATGTAPAKAAVRLRGNLTPPTAGQMALFVGDVQVSEPVQAGEGGTYIMTVSAAEVLLKGNAEPNGNAVTLTAKFVGNDNMADAAGTVDVRISAVAMAEKDGAVIGYYGVSNLDAAFADSGNDGATFTLLGDVARTEKLAIRINCTLDLSGHTIHFTSAAELNIFGGVTATIRDQSQDHRGQVISDQSNALVGGELTILDGGTFTSRAEGGAGVKIMDENAKLIVTNEYVVMQNENTNGYGLYVNSAQSVQLSAGTYSSILVESPHTLANLLAENGAYYKDNTPILLSELEGQKELADPVTVQECQHTGVEVKDLGDGKHDLTCLYCGYHSEHTTTLTATASGNTVTLNGGCGTEGCGYQTPLGTASFTFPKVTYGQSGDVTCAWDGPTGYYGVIEVIGGSQSQFDKNADEGIAERSWTLAQLFGSTKVTAGKHKLKVSFFSDAAIRSNACELDFTIDPAPLTADMVTLGQTDVTYNGTEQKPALTVKQGQTALTEGMDYEVSYTRDGVVTTDFTSAGTVNITVTGKGNYEGEVEKTFTIRQAESDVGTVTAETLENTLDVSQVVLSRTNQTPAGTLTLTDSTLKYGTNTYTWKFMPDDTVNYKAATGTVQVTVNDTIAPSAEYRLGTDGWKKFVNTVTFGLFCKDFKTVDIRSTDDTDAVTGSGIASTQYYISDREITDTDSIAWETYTESISLDALGKYFIYVKVTDNAGNTAVLNSEGIVVYAESTVSPAVFDYTYKENRDCTVQLAMNGNTFKGFTDREGNAVGINDYTIDGDGRLILKAAYLDTLDQGEYAYTVSVNPQGIETDQVTLAYTFTVNVKARELTVTGAAAAGRAYDGTNKVEITAVTLSGIAGSDTVAVDVSGIQGALSSANAGRYTSVTLPQLTLTGEDSGNYTLVQPQTAVPASVEITPLDAEITVGTAAYSKTFGDGAFTLDVTDNNPEAAVQYEVTEGADVVSVENGTVTIHAAGSATITATLPQSANYNAAESKAVTVTVAKKSGYTVDGLNRSYLYSRENTDSIDLAALLPKDCGTVTYGTPTVSGNVAYSTVPAVTDGKLSYTQHTGSVDAEGSITVTVTTQNYADITITVNVKLIDRIPVRLKEGTQVTLANNVLTYGEPLSKLAFNEVEFVTADGKTVAGTLAWKEAGAVPDAGTASAVWVFTPNDPAVYETVEGTAAITVNKAQPVVSAAPTVADRVYDPSVTLDGGDLSSATVTGVDGSTLEGTWSWQGAGIVPTVNNSGYVAVFTPRNTTNYETVSRTITVNVAKATPYIAVLPTAAGITYGDTLGASALTGGTVQYGNGAGQAGDKAGSTAAVTGTFTWQEPSAKPVAADSNVTEYTIVFMPSDTANYHPVEAKTTLTINKAQNAPNMPGSAMDVSNSLEKVGDVPLPEGWEWQASDQGTALEVGVAVNAVAVYAGADQGNYEKETVTVSITRSACDHAAGDILYTGAGEKAPTCTESGLGHRECTKCGSVVESGIVVKALEHTGGTATCSQRAVCTRCNQPYGDLDSGRHGDTEVRGFTAATCTAGGYTGDTYCKDCGAKTKTGNATPALGHDYTNTVTKEPTTGSEGIRTYTCTRCGHSYTESIPKLPEETHHHSYFGSVTKQPTCTDTGIRTYTCSCGDSYTETMAALGHHYQSSVTKQPTATAEGVMTYTCIRCGHSYTRPIAKLPGGDTGKPGDDTGKPGDDTGKPGGDTGKPGDDTGKPGGDTGKPGDDTGKPGGDTGKPGDDTGKPGGDTGKPGDDTGKPGDDTGKPGSDTIKPGSDTSKPGDTVPDSGSTEEGRPDTGIPFLKDGDGKTGWDVIRAEEEQAQEGSTINVDMNGSVVVPGDIFDRLKGKDITITFDMGNGILWSVSGKSVTGDTISPDVSSPGKAGDIDFSVKTETSAIPADIVNNITGERYSIQISLAHEGEFGFTAVLSIGLGRENAGYTASLYYYNESTGELEFICSDEVAEDGTVSLAFTHASDYVIAIDGEEESGSVTDPVQPGDQNADSTRQAEISPQTGYAWKLWWLIVAGALVIAMGIGAFSVVKKGDDE